MTRQRICKQCKGVILRSKRKDAECCSIECSYQYRIKVYGTKK